MPVSIEHSERCDSYLKVCGGAGSRDELRPEQRTRRDTAEAALHLDQDAHILVSAALRRRTSCSKHPRRRIRRVRGVLVNGGESVSLDINHYHRGGNPFIFRHHGPNSGYLFDLSPSYVVDGLVDAANLDSRRVDFRIIGENSVGVRPAVLGNGHTSRRPAQGSRSRA
ncbi:hypothetical protein ACLMAJ_29795 [Nocardia sp. KC 131]|uniref:hypothetical protein n=1 Tax=Nocardia arseniciresistens TaxID=3392119 RepID=UPI00398F8AD8